MVENEKSLCIRRGIERNGGVMVLHEAMEVSVEMIGRWQLFGAWNKIGVHTPNTAPPSLFFFFFHPAEVERYLSRCRFAQHYLPCARVYAVSFIDLEN